MFSFHLAHTWVVNLWSMILVRRHIVSFGSFVRTHSLQTSRSHLGGKKARGGAPQISLYTVHSCNQDTKPYHQRESKLIYKSVPHLHRSLFQSTSPTMASEARYCIENAKTGRSSCKKCKQQIEKGTGRVGKITPNPFSDDGGDMKVWYHIKCIFETLKVSVLIHQPPV